MWAQTVPARGAVRAHVLHNAGVSKRPDKVGGGGLPDKVGGGVFE